MKAALKLHSRLNLRASRFLLLAVLAALPLLSSCFPPPDPERQATVDALAAKMALTITAAADEENVEEANRQSTQASLAEATATPTPAPLQPTRTSAAAVDEEAIKATAEAERPVRAEVPFFGVDADKGRVGWVHPSFTLDAQGQDGIANRNDFAGVVAEDFVMSADITWNTQYGDSGCGFAVRADGNQNLPSQYIILMTRFANGHVGFLVISKGELVNGADLYPRSEDRRFSAENDTTNQLTVVGRGTSFEIYTNGVLVGVVDPNKPPNIPQVPELGERPSDPQERQTFTVLEQNQGQVEAEIMQRFRERQDLFEDSNKEFPRGFTSMVAVTQAGKVTCTFENAWLWLIED